MKFKPSIIVVIMLFFLAACASTQNKPSAQDERNPQFQYERAVVCIQYGFADEAVKYLNQALLLDPRHYLSYNLLGLSYITKANLPAAAQAFENCIAIQPDFSEAQNNVGTVYQELGQLDKAEAAFKKAYSLNQNYNASYNLAKIYYSQNKFELALDFVQKSLDKYDRSLLAWNLRGLIYENMNKFDDAVSSYVRALKIVPNEVNVSFNLGIVYYNNGQFDKAKEILEKARDSLAKAPANSKNDDLKAKINDVLKKLRERSALD